MASSTPILTDEERVRTRHHLGYLNVTDVQTFALGLPAAVQTQFIIEGCMDKIMPAALPQFRRILGILDLIEEQMVQDLELLAVNKVGSIDIRADEQRQLKDQYKHWQGAMCNILGAIANPYDARFGGGSGGGINVPVQH